MKSIVLYKDGTTKEIEIPDTSADNTEETLMQIQELKTWFETYYSQHIQKYNRLIALNKLTDEGTDPQEERLKLYETAEITRKRIQELESLIN